MKNIKTPKPGHLIRLIIAVVCLVLGGVFMVIPFIPLGYILLITGLFFLSYDIPFLRNIVEKIKKRDRKNRVDKITGKIEETESKINRIVQDNNKESS